MTQDQVEQIRAAALAVQANQEAKLATMRLWERLRRCEDRIKIMSTVPSAGISEYTTSSKSSTKAPPAQQTPDFRDELARIKAAVEMLEGAVRAETGGGVRQAFATMRGDEKDKELLKWAGTPAFKVATYAPWLGETPRTIEKARKRLGVRPWNGLELDVQQKRRWDEEKAA